MNVLDNVRVSNIAAILIILYYCFISYPPGFYPFPFTIYQQDIYTIDSDPPSGALV